MATAAKRVFKTKKVLSGVRAEYRAWKEWDEGDVLVFKLVGTQQNRKNKSKVDWIIEPVEAFFSDKKEEKRIMAAKRLVLNTAGQLDKGMEQLEEGDMGQVTYNGSKEMTGGDYAGEMAHTMEVESVEEDGGDESHEDEESEEDEDDEDL